MDNLTFIKLLNHPIKYNLYTKQQTLSQQQVHIYIQSQYEVRFIG